MSEETPMTTTMIKIQQYRNLAIVTVIILIILGALYWMMNSNSHPANHVPAKKLEVDTFASPMSHIDPQSVWLERAENQLKDEQRQTAELKQALQQLKNQTSVSATADDPHYQSLQQQITALQKAMSSKPDPGVSSTAKANERSTAGRTLITTPGALVDSAALDANAELTLGIDHDELNLKPTHLGRPQKNPDSFVPAGTFAEAIMLGAADASAGVMTQANPSPMLFRIIADGTLPNYQHSHLKDCVVTAAVVGDISSERGEIRLERMSCTFPSGEIVEQSVEGTVFGMDAKNGIRGSPVWREGSLLTRAAVAGTLSGIAQGVSQKYVTNSISPLGATQTVTGNEIFKYGAANGLSNAMEKLADYNIRRAEQYHPVIQLSAGQPVDVVFLKGFYLDGRSHETSKASADQPSELFTNDSYQTATGLTLSEQQLKKIKQHEQAMGLG